MTMVSRTTESGWLLAIPGPGWARKAMLPLLFLAALGGAPARAQAGLLVPTSSGHPDPAVLSMREMTVDVGISRGYARVNVRQVFENHTKDVQEGTYRFALPKAAAVGDFAIWDGLQRIPGVILEKRRARSIYSELTRQHIDPGLLQQGEEEDREAGDGSAAVRPSAAALFSVTVAPIPPMATKRLELQFNQELAFAENLGEFRLVLKPADFEAPVVHQLTIRIQLEDASFLAVAGGLPLTAGGAGATFTGTDVKLDRDLVFRIQPRPGQPLRLTAFRNPDGAMPDGLALAPWERIADIPPEKDGFFLLEALPALAAAGPARPSSHAPAASGDLAILFDTSLGHRWGGLETGYGHLVRVLHALGAGDRFALIPFDRTPDPGPGLRPVTTGNLDAALTALRSRSLGPGADLVKAVTAARTALAGKGRILLITCGQGVAGSKALAAAAGGLPLFTVVTAGEAGEALRNASVQTLSPTATGLDTDLFFERLMAPLAEDAGKPRRSVAGAAPFTVTGGEPRLRDIYPVLTQPLTAGALSGWVGRYAAPQAKVHINFPAPLLAGHQDLDTALPAKALEARDLPRRWARARVDDLLARIEAEGERREWIEEIIALSKRYKFVTPYTAFLAAPRSLLRPRRIQPGDPVLRVECDPGTVAVTALFPFGLKLDLVRRPDSTVWEGRFLAPDGLKDGRYEVRILLKDRSGARSSETKHFILDGTAPEIRPELPASARAGEAVTIAVRTDKDVVFLTARVGGAPPVPLRWDPEARRCTGVLHVPDGLNGPQEVFFEAVDAAKNRGFARGVLEVKP
jgi:Ca-activated chloride channel family protein